MVGGDPSKGQGSVMGKRTTTPRAGCLVLVGSPKDTLPYYWFVARVLWADNEDVLIEHTPPSGTKYRSVIPVEHVRAMGSLHVLVDYKDRCSAAIEHMRTAVFEAETALDAARKAVWSTLDGQNLGSTCIDLDEQGEGAS